MIPYERAVEFISDVYGHQLSEATVFNANCAIYEALESAEQKIISQLIASPVVHLDETEMRIVNSRQWVHVVSNDKCTHYAHHSKRGNEATDEIGVLPSIEGTAVHDHWKPYYNYNFSHALCNAHHLRELTGILELTEQQWPQEMIDLLLEIKDAVDKTKTIAHKFNPDDIKDFELRYDEIIAKGYSENPPPTEPSVKKRGRKKQSKARNMLNRLENHKSEVLAFMHHFNVPFDNNLAERDLRMIKVKQKISGVFRSDLGAKIFCRVRGYISTARKNSIPVLGAIKTALDDNPFVPIF